MPCPKRPLKYHPAAPLSNPLSDAELQYLPYHLRDMLSIIDE